MIPWARRRGPLRSFFRSLSPFAYHLCFLDANTLCIVPCSWFPVVFLAIIIIWVYYVAVFVVMIFRGPDLPDKPIAERVIHLLIGHILLVLFLSTYLRLVFGKHKKIPEQFNLSHEVVDKVYFEGTEGQSSLEDAATNLPVYTVNHSGGVRWCTECQIVKPDRCHHCFYCGRCVLMMNHHCAYFNNCIGYSNYKLFLHFILYTALICTYIELATASDVSHVWTSITQTPGGNTTTGEQFEFSWTNFHVISMFTLVSAFGLANFLNLFIHICLVCSNKTAIEKFIEPVHPMDGKDGSIFNVGIWKNLKQVFGSNVILAFLPIFTSEGDGIEFTMARDVVDLSEAKAQQLRCRRQQAKRSEGPSSEPNMEDDDETLETQPLQH